MKKGVKIRHVGVVGAAVQGQEGVEIKAHCFMGLCLSWDALSVIVMKYDLHRLLNRLIFPT